MANRKLVASAACTAVVALAGCAGGSSAAKSGSIHLVSDFQRNGNASVVVTGIISDTGRSFPADATGKANRKDNYEEAVLGDGTFLLDENALNSVKPTGGLNHSTCVLALSFSASVPVSRGTGAYTGIHGSVHAVAVVHYHVPRYSSGPRKGTCNAAEKPPAGSYSATVTAQGAVTY